MLTIGLMTGTSMDGIDAALIETNGETDIKEYAHAYYSYDSNLKLMLKAAQISANRHFGNLNIIKKNYYQDLISYLKKELKISSDKINNYLADLKIALKLDSTKAEITFDKLITALTILHAQLVKTLLNQTNFKAENIDVIGFHGQTLFHSVAKKITIQIGDGKLLADMTGITVVNNFRSQDLALGGQGAPLAPLYHQALAVRDKMFPVVVVNCGGIANVTVITNSSEEGVMGFDTGPGNALIDRYITQKTQGKKTFDQDGKYGTKGKVCESVLKTLFEKSVILNGKNYFDQFPPKALDSGNMHLIPELDSLSFEDACRTLEEFTAETIVHSVKYFPKIKLKNWVLVGGGWNNPVILESLKSKLIANLGADTLINKAENVGWNSQAMEAQLFAYLAVRSLKKMTISLPSITQIQKPSTGGNAHFPT